MHAEQKIEMRILTEARAAIDANHAQANELSHAERQRRVEAYRLQVERVGRITCWLGAAAEGGRPHRSRFVFGDAMGRRGKILTTPS